jgi:hypothetical protein
MCVPKLELGNEMEKAGCATLSRPTGFYGIRGEMKKQELGDE